MALEFFDDNPFRIACNAGNTRFKVYHNIYDDHAIVGFYHASVRFCNFMADYSPPTSFDDVNNREHHIAILFKKNPSRTDIVNMQFVADVCNNIYVNKTKFFYISAMNDRFTRVAGADIESTVYNVRDTFNYLNDDDNINDCSLHISW